MKEFIVSVLNHLGMGVNGIMPKDPNIYMGRLREYARGMGFSILENGNMHLIIRVFGKSDDFCIVYNFECEGRRITYVSVEERMA